MDYYQILELDETCSKDEIKKKYRSLSLKYHPDKNNSPDAEEKYKSANSIPYYMPKLEIYADIGVHEIGERPSCHQKQQQYYQY